jgi:myo-inositol-1(or 4)-monophosphatase
MSPDHLHATLHDARALVRQTAHEAARLADSLRSERSKGGVDLVTAADGHIEAALTTALHARFPGHRIKAEEGTRLGPDDSPWCWHLDPLDGTGNFSRGLPYWAVSLGLAYDHQPMAGIIVGPQCGLDLAGGPGLGAWDGDRPLPQAGPAGEERTWMIATDWPWDVVERQRTCAFLTRMAPRIRQYKTYGSAAVDLAHVALGKVDAYLISKIFPWDQAGGAAICAALGYELRRWDGSGWDLRHPDIVACRPGMWPGLATALAP